YQDMWLSIAQAPEALEISPSSLDAEHLDYLGGYRAGGALWDLAQFGDPRLLPVFAISRSRLSALPPMDEPMRLVKSDGNWDEVIHNGADPGELLDASNVAMGQVRTFLEMVVTGTVSQLLESLRDAIYIGPLREIPQRGFLYERVGRT